MQLLKEQLGDVAAQITFQKLAEVMNGLNNRYSKHDLEDVLLMIKKELANDVCFGVYEGVVALELVNYNYHKWSGDKKLIVAQKIAARLGRYAKQVAENSLHYDQKLNILLEISQDIKLAIADNTQNALLLEAIQNNNADLVCERLAAGADPSEHIHLTISDPSKTHLLPLLLRAGVNPVKTFRIEGIIDTVSKSVTSIKNFVKAPAVIFAKVGSELSKESYNPINYAVHCGNEEALDFLLSCDSKVDKTVPIYYSRQCEEALQAKTEKSGKYNGGSALTIALMNHDQPYSRNIAIKLLRAGAKLQVVKEGGRHAKFNNLQLLVIFNLEPLLYEVLSTRNKSKAQLLDLSYALVYKSDSRDDSKKLAEVLSKEYCSEDIQAAFALVSKELPKLIQQITNPKTHETKHRSIKAIPQREGGDAGQEIQRVIASPPVSASQLPELGDEAPVATVVAVPSEVVEPVRDNVVSPVPLDPLQPREVDLAQPPLVPMDEDAPRPTQQAKPFSVLGCCMSFWGSLVWTSSNEPAKEADRKMKLE